MKGWRFYEEFEDDARKVPTGNVVAIPYPQTPYFTQEGAIYGVICVSAVFPRPNSPVASGMVNLHYKECRTKRISEAKAREIHKNLFHYLEGGQQSVSHNRM